MLDINFIRQNSQKVKEACENKNVKCDVDAVLELDKKRRELITESESLKSEQNKISKAGRDSATVAKAKELKEKFKTIEPKIKETEEKLNALLLQLPNIPFDDVPIGKDDSQNVIVRQVGKPLKLNTPTGWRIQNYIEIAEKLDLIDTKRAAKIAGSRFGYIKGELVLIEFAIVKMVFDLLIKKGFRLVLPPVMLKEEMARGTGYFEATDKDEAYFIPQDNLFLAGTAEQSLVAMHANEVLNEKDLPKRYAAFSTCFRREAGSYGKDTKGILRVHQFDKLEMVIFSTPEQSKKELEFLLSIEEELMKKLGLPYQVVNICTGDLGRPAAKKYDIEAWIPSENKYRETHSTSNCTDFQSRRLNIRYKDKNNKMRFAHTLNGTAFAMPRTLIAIIENYQQKDGLVKVPKALIKYCGFKKIE